MKHNLIKILALSLVCGLLLAGCKEEKQSTEENGQYTVSLSHTTATMEVYGKLELTAMVKDSAGTPVEAPVVSWSSSDPKVAQVHDGIVIAGSEGQADITATLDSGETAVCRITTENKGMIPQVVVENITAGKLSIASGQTYHLTGKVTFGGADCTEADTIFSFRVADTSVATVSQEGVIQAVGQGSTQVIVTATWRGMGGEALAGGQDAYGLQMIIDLTVVDL